MLDALGAEGVPAVRVLGTGSLPSIYRVSDLAVASIAAAGASLAGLIGDPREIVVDRALAAHWFHLSIRPDGWQPPSLWDAVAGDYQSADGWIRLHTNAPHHRAAALRVLGVDGDGADRAAVAAAVARWRADELESAVVDAGGAAAAMRSIE
jgi:hypothetical protein